MWFEGHARAADTTTGGLNIMNNAIPHVAAVTIVIYIKQFHFISYIRTY